MAPACSGEGLWQNASQPCRKMLRDRGHPLASACIGVTGNRPVLTCNGAQTPQAAAASPCPLFQPCKVDIHLLPQPSLCEWNAHEI